jgi:hypothetical protein
MKMVVFVKKEIRRQPMGLGMNDKAELYIPISNEIVNERRAVTKKVGKRYQKARKREKGRILDEFIKLLPDIPDVTHLMR